MEPIGQLEARVLLAQDDDPATRIAETRRPVRIDDWSAIPGSIAEFVRSLGIRSSVGSPIIVEGRLWGALAVHSRRSEPLPPDSESRLLRFTELVATAISNAQARGEVERLAEEQAALRRVATAVAASTDPRRVFSVVTEEVARLLGAQSSNMVRFNPDGTATVMGGWSTPPIQNIPVGDTAERPAANTARR